MVWPIPNRNSGKGDGAAARPRGSAPADALPLRGWPAVVLAGIYIAGFALAARLLVSVEDVGLLPWYVALLTLFFALYTLVWARPALAPVLKHLIIAVLCAIAVLLLLLDKEMDFATSFLALLSYQVALVFSSRVRWAWVGIVVALIAGSLMITHGAAEGLGLALTSMAIAVVLPGLALAARDLEISRATSRRILAEVQAANEQLREYAARVEDLAIMEERNRLARELHDSVSQAMFGIQLATRSAQIMLGKDPASVEAQLAQLQELTRDALVRMRSFIAELRPKS